MATRMWRTLDDGRTEVDGVVPTLIGADAASFDTRVMRWLDLARKHSDRTGVPAAIILGMIKVESEGVPTAVNPERLPGPEDDGIGLMQITSSVLKKGHTDEELKDPDLNIRIGTDYITSFYRPGVPVPALASMFNCGAGPGPSAHPSSKSPWGLCETTGHIDRVVAATNYAIEKLGGRLEQVDLRRILCVGDSLTVGLAGGYRAELAKLLAAAGVHAEFVGGVDGPGGKHEGHTGMHAAEMAARLNGWLATYRPTDVVLLAGTNDMPGSDIDGAFVHLVQMVDAVTAAGARLVLCTIPPMRDDADHVERWNAGVGGLAESHGVELADVESVVSLADLAPDGVHPASVETYRAMARVIVEPLRKAGGPPSDPPSPPTVASAVGGIVAVIVGALLVKRFKGRGRS